MIGPSKSPPQALKAACLSAHVQSLSPAQSYPDTPQPTFGGVFCLEFETALVHILAFLPYRHIVKPAFLFSQQ